MASFNSDALRQLFESQQANNPDLYATAITTLLPGGGSTSSVSWRTSAAYGQADFAASSMRAMSLDTPVRLGAVSELLVVAAALLIPAIAKGLNQPVDNKYLPHKASNVVLRNPAYPNQDITYKMLMQHTSSISEPGYAGYALSASCTVTGVCGGTQAEDFRTFVENVFSTSTSTLGTTTFDPAVFGSQMPGAVNSYSHSRLNTALLAYVIDDMIKQGAVTVNSQVQTVGSFIEEQILVPLGMASTFYLLQDGSVPKLTNQAIGQYEKAKVSEYDQSGTADARYVHSNYPGDVMQFSSSLDIGFRLASVLLAPPLSTTGDCEPVLLCQVGRLMRSNQLTVTSPSHPLQVGQGLGVVFYDPEAVCAQTVATGLFSKCPLTSSHTLWGFVSGGMAGVDRTSIPGILCTDGAAGASERASCVSVMQAVRYNQATPTDTLSNFAMAGAAFQTTFGEAESPLVTRSSDDDDLYGLWVFFGVVGTVGFVLVASYFTEFLIQPANANPPAVKPRAADSGM